MQRLSTDETISQQDWASILQAKEAINKVIEQQRSQGLVKGSLGADIELFADQNLYDSLAKLGDELRFVTITSKALLRPLADSGEIQDSMLEGLKVAVKQSDATKCVRCWHFIDDVGSNSEHPDVCGRCIDNINGHSETRAHA